MEIANPVKFWGDLLIRFMASTNKSEHLMILMCMCVLYRIHAEQIREMATMPYFLKLLGQYQGEYSHCSFLILQLIHIAISVDKSGISKANIAFLVNSDGFNVLHQCLNQTFVDLETRRENEEESAQNSYKMLFGGKFYDPNSQIKPLTEQSEGEQGLLEIQSEKYVDDLFGIHTAERENEENKKTQDIYRNSMENFTNSATNYRYFRRNSRTICQGILVLKVFDQISKSVKLASHLPLPSNLAYILRNESLASLTQLLMLQNDDITREILQFFENHLESHYALFKLKNSGLIEFLILCLSSRNAERALNLLAKIQEICTGYNVKLNFEKFDRHDFQMVLEEKTLILKIRGKMAQRQKSNSEVNSQTPEKIQTSPQKDIHSEEKIGQKFPNLFDNDYQSLKEQGRRLPPLLESIFLRYLPVPLIRFFHENRKEQFLAIFNSDEYRHPTLIWTSQMRRTLEKRIQETALDFVKKLIEFMKKDPQNLKPNLLPVYTNEVEQVIRYEQISEEVRCGRLFLGVWVSQSKQDFITNSPNWYQIPHLEEKDFNRKICTELQLCIQEQSLDAQYDKILILFKACLMALRHFQNKIVFFLPEIQTILESTCGLKNQDESKECQPIRFELDDPRKPIVYQGMKIIQNAISMHESNREQFLGLQGTDFIHELSCFILENSDETEGSKVKSQLTRVDTKILNLCVLATHTMFKEYPSEFQRKPFVERVAIFRQQAKMLDLSFQLYPFLDQRELKNQNSDQQKQPILQSAQMVPQQQSEQVQSNQDKQISQKVHQFERISTRMSVQQATVQDFPQNEQPSTKQSPNKDYPNQQKLIVEEGFGKEGNLLPPLDLPEDYPQFKNVTDQNQEKNQPNNNIYPYNTKKIYKAKRSKLINYQQRSLLEIIGQTKEESGSKMADSYAICQILNLANSVFEFTKLVCQYPNYHADMIGAGIAWRVLQHCYFDLTSNVYRRAEILKNILKNCTYTLRMLITLCYQIGGKKVQHISDANESLNLRQLEQEMLENEIENIDLIRRFLVSIQKIFTSKMEEKLTVEIDRGLLVNQGLLMPTSFNKKVDENAEIIQKVAPEISSKSFLNLFSIQCCQSPELVWNNQTRKELLEKLEKQIEKLLEKQADSEIAEFDSEFLDFEYSVNQTELRIEGIFVKYFNENCRKGQLTVYSMQKQSQFADKMIDKLEELAGEFNEQETLNQTNLRYITELVEAFKNLMIYLGHKISIKEDFEHYFNTLCSLVDLKFPDTQEGQTLREAHLKNLTQNVLTIVHMIVRNCQKSQILLQEAKSIVLKQNMAQMNLLRNSHQSRRQNQNQISQTQLIAQALQLLDVQQKSDYFVAKTHADFLLSCESFVQLLIRIFNESSILNILPFENLILPVVEDIISLPEYSMWLFIDRGLIMFLIDLIFASSESQQPSQNNLQTSPAKEDQKSQQEKDRSSFYLNGQLRAQLTEQVLRIERQLMAAAQFSELGLSGPGNSMGGQAGVIKAFVPYNFFAEINEQVWRRKNYAGDPNGAKRAKNDLMEMVLKFLTNFDASKYENALLMWNERLRHQSQKQVRAICDMIANRQQFPNLLHLNQLVDAEMVFEERVLNVILRNYNQNPSVFINVKLNVFISDLATQIFAISQQLDFLVVNQKVSWDQIVKKIENPELMSNEQRNFYYCTYKATLQGTSLLLAIEQLLFNEFNPNQLQTRKDGEKMGAQARLTAQLIERTAEIRQIEERVFEFVALWLQSGIFTNIAISDQLRITFLQVVFLILDVPGCMSFLSKTEIPLHFLGSQITRICQESTRKEHKRLIEDGLILLIAQKLLRIDQQYTCPHLVMKDNIDKLVHIAQSRKPLSRHIEYIMYLILQNTHYATNIIEVLERKNRNRHDLDKLKGSDRIEYFLQIWRGKANSSSHARNYYEFAEQTSIDRALYVGKIDKLPILSIKAMQKYPREGLPDEIKQLIDPPQQVIPEVEEKKSNQQSEDSEQINAEEVQNDQKYEENAENESQSAELQLMSQSKEQVHQQPTLIEDQVSETQDKVAEDSLNEGENEVKAQEQQEGKEEKISLEDALEQISEIDQ